MGQRYSGSIQSCCGIRTVGWPCEDIFGHLEDRQGLVRIEWIPHVELIGAADHHVVLAREDIGLIGAVQVLERGLRFHQHQLALDRSDVRCRRRCPCEPMPVQLTTIGSGNRTTSAADAKVRWVSWTAPGQFGAQLREEDRRFDQQGVVAVPLLVQMLEGQMVVFRRLRDHVDRHLPEARLLPRVFGVVDSFGDAVALPDPVAVHGEGGAQDVFEPLCRGRAVLVLDERRAPLAARDVGRGVEERRRVHPHREAGLDEQLRGGQPHHSRAEHRDLSQRGARRAGGPDRGPGRRSPSSS